MYSYDTVTEAISDLQQRGYTHNFDLHQNCLHCDEQKIDLHPEDFEVDEFYRFEGDSDPGDENVVYAISSVKYDLKGVLMSAFGMYADISSTELLQKLKFHQ